MHKKTVFTILYLMVATSVVFYWPKIMAGFGNSGGETPRSLAAEAPMDEDAYYALREVASVQLGYVVISYEEDGKSGLYRKRFTNAACPNTQIDPEQIIADQKTQQVILHQLILELAPPADTDGSGFVDNEEGVRFRDLFEFGHLAHSCMGADDSALSRLAKAAGLKEEEAAEKLQSFRSLHLSAPVLP